MVSSHLSVVYLPFIRSMVASHRRLALFLVKANRLRMLEVRRHIVYDGGDACGMLYVTDGV